MMKSSLRGARSLRLMMVVCALVLGIFGTERAQPAPTGPSRGGTLTIAYPPITSHIDVTAVNNNDTNEIAHYVYETLFDRDPQGTVRPLLVKEETISSDGLTVTWKLQPNVKFHDGSPFNAAAVKWNLERKVQKKQPLFDLLPPIKSIETVNDLTVRVTFGRPSFNVKATLSAKTFSMLSPTFVQKVGDDGLKQQASGTGPFTVTEFRPLEVLRLKRNPNYWQKDLPYLNEVVFRVVPDVNTRATMLEAGDVDMAESLSAPDTVRFKGTSGIRILDALGSRQYYITINNLRPPLNDPRVRQALNYAVAVQGIINTVFLGAARPATAVYVNPILSGYVSGGGYGYDPERARRQLEDAGWRVGAGGIREKDGKPLRLEFYAAKGLNTGDFETAELVQAMLRVIGVDARLSILEPAAFRLRITKPPDQAEYDLVLLTVGTFTGDAEYIMLTFYHTKSFAPVYYNRAYYSNPQVDEMIDRSLGVTSRAERDKIYAQVIKQVVKDAPIIMLFDTLERVAIKADVQGVYLEKAGNNWIGKYAWRGRR